MDLESITGFVLSGGFRTALLSLCVILLIVVLSREGMHASPQGELFNHPVPGNPYGTHMKYHSMRDDTGHGCGCSQSLAEQQSKSKMGTPNYMHDSTWPPTPNPSTYNVGLNATNYDNPVFNRNTSTSQSHTDDVDGVDFDSSPVFSERALAEHKLGVGA